MMSETTQYMIEQYRLLHKTMAYGNTSESLKSFVLPFVGFLKPKSILDYGCGQSRLLEILRKEDRLLDAKLYKFDPAIEEYEVLVPQNIDMIICTDVLEHIPEDELDGLLRTIKIKSDNIIFTICCREAIYNLPDGQNCHCTIRPKKWWISKIRKYFPRIEHFDLPGSDYFLCATFKINWKVRFQILLVRLKLSKIPQRLYQYRYVKNIYRFIFKQGKPSQ